MYRSLMLVSVISLLLSCQTKTADTTQKAPEKDPHSFAEPERALVKHLDLDIKVDFEKQLISGKAVWTIENTSKNDEIIFDTRQLNIQKVTIGDDEKETMFALGDEVKYMGKPLSVNIDPSTTKVTIWYSTSKDAAALQWLNPQQTAGKVHPFLFTQSEAILARTWIPCQDSPGIRFTYKAKVSVPKDLLALMSAENPKQKSTTGNYEFNQPHPIPSYLMALAVGDIAFQEVNGRTGVYAEPSVVKKAAWEFADMGKMVDAAEKIYGPYQWGRYDVIVLPPSFPFGGMENPMLTFATPTAIAGDRSLVSLIAHELAHSWSGNLVTNATWNDFWLNEGFTTYFERRIVEALYGKDEARMQEVLGRQDLNNTLEDIGKTNPDTRLKADFKDRDPDEGVSDIAYEKGSAFLRTIEEAVGRERFDVFLRGYFDSHKFQSATTEDFLAYLDDNLLKNTSGLKEKIQVDAWVYQPGIPSNIVPARSEKFNLIDSLLAGWDKTKSSNGLSEQVKSTNERLYFIKHLSDKTNAGDMMLLDKEFGFTQSGNAEIQCAWYTLAVRYKYKSAYSHIEKFLTEVGRRKFLTPLYTEMAKSPEGKKWAKEIYVKARPNYHSVSYNSIDVLLK
ncbi:MAG TPA: aminopeptidase [Sphingobacteriaceae bacterium]|nr:aminopeptidase [Sphingobacteriaceae bacterium]